MPKANHYYPDQLKKIKNRNSLFQIKDLTLSARIQCLLCSQVMIEPSQIDCGCRFCFDCILQYQECPNCNENIIKVIRDKAIEREILNLSVKCINEGCSDVIVFRLLSEHLVICKYRIQRCYKCNEFYSLANEDEHLINNCAMEIIECKDCQQQMIREQFQTQLRNYNDLESICNRWISKCPFKCEESRMVNLKEHLNKCSNRPCKCPMAEFGCQEMMCQNSINDHLNEYLSRHQLLLLAEIRRLVLENEEMKSQNRTTENKLGEQLKELEKMNSEHLAEIFKLTRNVERLSSDIERLSLSNSSPDQTEIVSDNGHVTYTISDIRDKIRSAKLGGSNQIISEPVYLTRHGYRVALKVYLNGDGCGNNEFLSVYFVIFKGDYDDQLSWPFTSKVILSLQSNDPCSRDIVVRMKPDINPSCYGRPMTEHNVAAGQPQFVKLTDILYSDKYITDGRLILRMTVIPR